MSKSRILVLHPQLQVILYPAPHGHLVLLLLLKKYSAPHSHLVSHLDLMIQPPVPCCRICPASMIQSLRATLHLVSLPLLKSMYRHIDAHLRSTHTFSEAPMWWLICHLHLWAPLTPLTKQIMPEESRFASFVQRMPDIGFGIVASFWIWDLMIVFYMLLIMHFVTIAYCQHMKLHFVVKNLFVLCLAVA